MELGFIVTSLRRRWWLVVLALLAGVAIASTIEADESVRYRAVAQVEVQPDPSSGNTYSGAPDRFVATEIATMRAGDLVTEVAEVIPGDDVTAGQIASATSLSQQQGTNIVNVAVTTDDEALAPVIANTYVDTYLERSRVANNQARQSLLDDLRTEETELRAAIAEVDQRKSDIAEAYRQSLLTDDPLPPPNIGVIAPDLQTQSELLESQFRQLQGTIQDVVSTSQESFRSRVIQRAGDPAVITGDSPALTQAAIVVGALLLGLLVAPLSAQLSSRVADAGTVEELLGRRLIGHLGWSARLRRSPLAALARAPRHHDEVERRLWARVERGATAANGGAVVTVAGTTARAGTTTVCLALARRAAENGLRTVIVDADTVNPWLSEHFVGEVDAPRSLDTRLRLAPTPRPGVGVLAATPMVRQGTPVGNLLSGLMSDVDLVIVDAGDLLSSSGAVMACEIADSVVITVPLGRVRENDLRDTGGLLVGEQGSSVRAPVLPVTTRPSRRPASGSRYDGGNAASGPASERRRDAAPDDDEPAPGPVEETAGTPAGGGRRAARS